MAPNSKLSSGLRQQQKEKPTQSKNLSHVPCKFFRQGACQAGDSCPFSHDPSDVIDQPPCKYFQKGNCKFGSKCALAHILPDGRRVNPKRYNNDHHKNGTSTQQQQKQPASTGNNGHSQQAQQAQHGNGHTHNGSLGSASAGNGGEDNVGTASAAITGSAAGNGTANGTLSSPSNVSQSLPQPVAGGSAPQGPSTPAMRSVYGSNYGLSEQPSHNSPRSYSHSHSSEPQGSLGMPLSLSPLPVRSIWNNSSASASDRPNSFTRPAASSLLSMMEQNEYAVDDEDVFEDEEEFVPSSLNDLLTPQERQRRGSRRTSGASGALADLWGPGHTIVGPSSVSGTTPIPARTSFTEPSDSPLSQQATSRVLNPIGTPDHAPRGSLSQRIAAGIGSPASRAKPIVPSFAAAASSASTTSAATPISNAQPDGEDDTQFYLEQDEGDKLDVIDKMSNVRI